MSRREDIYDDDQVEIMLDTFHDRRRAYAFQTTPLGVQWDAIWTEASREEETQGHFDTSFDTVWDSRGKVTDRGFVVWMAIPFKSLRFPATKLQEWGIILYRGITRKTEDSFWPHVSYKVEGRLGQAATLYGLEGISPGRDIELIPYGLMRGFRALDTRDFSNPYFQKATVQGQPGMDAKFVFHDHFTRRLPPRIRTSARSSRKTRRSPSTSATPSTFPRSVLSSWRTKISSARRWTCFSRAISAILRPEFA